MKIGSHTASPPVGQVLQDGGCLVQECDGAAGLGSPAVVPGLCRSLRSGLEQELNSSVDEQREERAEADPHLCPDRS